MGTIVIYEPDDLMCRLLGEWLTSAGYTVYGATAVDPDARVSLVVASISTRALDRETLIARLQRKHPDASMLALCSQARSGLCSDGELALALGVDRVMAKPLRRGEFLATVASLIDPAVWR